MSKKKEKNEIDKEKMKNKQIKNRLCARRCREKKKEYVKTLEEENMLLKEEIAKWRNIQMKEKKIEYEMNKVIFF